MSSTPTLSYKKPSQSNQVTSASSLPAKDPKESKESSHLGPPTPVLSGSRKFLSRRKALHEYYRLETEPKQGSPTKDAPELTQSSDAAFAGDKMDAFLESSTIEDILKARNGVSGTQTSQDSEKKEIVYDNYYELIKLNATLDTLSNPSAKKDDDIVVQSHTIGDTYVDDTLNELADFVTNVASKYSTDFSAVVRNLNVQHSDDTASMVPIRQDHRIPEDVDKKQLINEISTLLSKKNLQDNEKTTIGREIDDIIQSLDAKNQELLILQLNELKKQYI